MGDTLYIAVELLKYVSCHRYCSIPDETTIILSKQWLQHSRKSDSLSRVILVSVIWHSRFMAMAWTAWNHLLSECFFFQCCGHCKVHCFLGKRSVCVWIVSYRLRISRYHGVGEFETFQNDMAKMQTFQFHTSRCVRWLLAGITSSWMTITAMLIPFWVQLIGKYSQLPSFNGASIALFFPLSSNIICISDCKSSNRS